MDAWCHLRNALYSFAVETIQRVKVLPEKAQDIAGADLDAHFTSAYGIREQLSELLPDGSYRLRVPYADGRELLTDILRHGRHVEVEGPESLRRHVADAVSALTQLYHGEI